MSNEYSDWRRDRVLEFLPDGWEVVLLNGREVLAKGNTRLTIEDAYEIQEKAYEIGVNTILEEVEEFIKSNKYSL